MALARGGQAEAHRQCERLIAVYREVYRDNLHDPFYSAPRYRDRLMAYATRDGFTLVTGEIEGELVGYALGATLPAGTRWWNGLHAPMSPQLIAEDGRRTFALNEIMVREPWRRRGHARALHDALLDGRPEQRATLLVDPANEPARSAYLSWGWLDFGLVTPFPDSPTFDALLLDLTRG
ncbi:MAG: GNAT family N-acetyltransferase [Hamadaea sp.]|nr:GNAT family N-acetyltransferase [Hamadaea sp.]